MVINMLDPELLRTFLAVERAGGFTAAGRLLGLRQSWHGEGGKGGQRGQGSAADVGHASLLVNGGQRPCG